MRVAPVIEMFRKVDQPGNPWHKGQNTKIHIGSGENFEHR